MLAVVLGIVLTLLLRQLFIWTDLDPYLAPRGLGMDVFTLVDTGTWYVVGNFRETQLRHMRQGSAAEIYLQSQPNRRFQGTVVGLGWAVLPEYGTSVNGLPKIDRQLDWVRLAQRFPVRIRVDNPDDSFRLGASAVVTVRGDTGPEAQTSRH